MGADAAALVGVGPNDLIAGSAGGSGPVETGRRVQPGEVFRLDNGELAEGAVSTMRMSPRLQVRLPGFVEAAKGIEAGEAFSRIMIQCAEENRPVADKGD